MCYKYPGPRCSSSAIKRLRKAKAAADTPGAGYEEYASYLEAEEDFYVTPAGLKHLREKWENATDPQKSLANRVKYRHYQDKRRDALAVVKLSYNESTDVDTSHQAIDHGAIEVKDVDTTATEGIAAANAAREARESAAKAAKAAEAEAASTNFTTNSAGYVTGKDAFLDDNALTLGPNNTLRISENNGRRSAQVTLGEQEMDRLVAIADQPPKDDFEYELETTEDGKFITINKHFSEENVVSVQISDQYKSNPYDSSPTIEIDRRTLSAMARKTAPAYA